MQESGAEETDFRPRGVELLEHQACGRSILHGFSRGSIKWSTPLIASLLILVVVVLIVAYQWSNEVAVSQLAIIAPTIVPSPQLEPSPGAQATATQVHLYQLTFPKGPRRVVFTLGSTSIDYSASDLAHWLAPVSPKGPIVLEDLRPIEIQVENGILQVRATVFAGHGKGSLRVSSTSTLESLPLGWDRNSNDRAIEVVNEKREPVLQLLYKSDFHVAINGLFATDDGHVLVVDGTGVRRSPADNYMKLAPIFKYPAKQYPARYAESPKVPPGWLHSIFK